MSDTPLADAVLGNPLAIPPGLEGALRNVERGARQARDRLRTIVAAGAPVPAVTDALARLDRFLDDERHSPFRRALRRPLPHVAPGTPAWRRLESSWRSAVVRAAAAARLQSAVEELRAERARITARFADALPYWTAFHLRRERVTEDEIERLRRDDGRRPVLERLRHAEGELERIHAFLPPADALVTVQLADAWPAEAAPGELLAAVALRLAERGAGAGRDERAPRIRAAAARHLHALGDAGGWTRVAATPAHTLAEQLAAASLASAGQVRWTDDAPLWAGLAAAAADALHGTGGRDPWQPQLSIPAADAVPNDWGTTHFAVPLSPDFVLLTPETPSAVRVASRRLALDAAVECTAFSGAEGFETVEAARRDANPLFAGLAPEPAWYRTVSPARLTIVARAGAAWIARLDVRGEIEPAATSAWRSAAPREARLRVLLDGVSAPPREPVVVGAAGGEPSEFGGVELREVEAPYAAHRWLWLKTSARRDEDRLEAEHELFRRLAWAAPASGLRPLGRARLERPRAEGWLYVPPFAFREASSPPLARLMAAQPIAFIMAVARAAAALPRTQMALGVFHRGAFAFRVEWNAAGVVRPVAVITAAPYAIMGGERFAPIGRRIDLIPEFTGLGVRLLPPAVAAAGLAARESDAQAWALFALDLLARKRLPDAHATVDEVAGIALGTEGAEHFHNPDAAARFGAALRNPERALTLLESLGRVGESSPSP